MIAKLQGVVDTIEPEWIVLMVGGVGYRVFVPMSTAHRLAPQEPATLYIFTHVREDAILLYGFHDRSQQRAFESLLTVTGVGPKLALAVTSHLTVDQLVRAVQGGDTRTLTRVPGIGRKTAERLVLELKDRFKSWSTEEPSDAEVAPSSGAPNSLEEDVIAALVQLGYPDEASRSAARSVVESGEEPSLEAMLRSALRRLQSI